MSWRNRVIWAEGMFLRPHHFQQHDRYFERFVEQRSRALTPYSWGVTELAIDTDLLALGKLALTVCRGVLPDGTPVNIPDDDEPPLPIEIDESVKNQQVYLTLPVRQVGGVEVDAADRPEGMARYLPREYEVRGGVSGEDDPARVQVGSLRLRLMLEGETRDEHACLGVARIVECRTDRTVVLDEKFIPPCLDVQASPQLSGFIKDLLGLLHHRSEALAARVSEVGRGGVSELGDFLLLQVVNRHEPLFAHLASMTGLHPESLYGVGLGLAGELSTFTTKDKRPGSFAVYDHEDLRATFTPLMAALRQHLSMVLEQNAIPLPIQEHKYGIRVSPISDRSLLKTAMFVLAVRAQMPAETLRASFPKVVKIGPAEQIRQIVNAQVPGIRVQPMAVAPRQIPYHAGFTYFELDRSGEFWKRMATSGGFAFHIGAEFPGIELQFWAIKGQ